MIIFHSQIVEGKPFKTSFITSYADEKFVDLHPLVSVKPSEVEVEILEVGDILTISFKGKISVVLECSYTLDKINSVINIDESLEFSTDVSDNELDHLTDDNRIDLDDYFFSALLPNIPMRVKKSGMGRLKSGAGYDVIDEDEYARRKRNRSDDRLSKLDEIEID